MAQQKFNAAEREAIWLAHEKKCAYTRELIEVASMHIDHVLAESLADDPARFSELKKTLFLSDSFDLRGFENLLPCKPGINLQKGKTVFDPARVHYFLGLAAGKKNEIQTNLEKIERRRNRDRALILLQQCLEMGDLKAEDVAEMLERHPDDIFRLLEGLRFADESEVKRIAKADISELRNRPIKLGSNEQIDGVTLTNAANETVYVRTCNEYDAAVAAGYLPYSTFDIKMSVFFRHQCGLLTALDRATLARSTFIDEPRVGIGDLELLPISFFPAPERPDGKTLGEGSYQTKVDDGTFIVRKLRSNLLVIEEPEGMGQQLLEVARADFDGDGIEDILLFEYNFATRGTLGYGGIKVITRKGPGERFEDVEL